MKNTANCMIINLNKSLLPFRLAALMLAVAFLFAGCAAGMKPVETPPPDITENTPAPPVPVQGGILRCPMPENLHINNEDYNPLLIHTEEALQLFTLVYEPLITVDESNMLIPALAINWTPDILLLNAWVINLRENAYWHNGEPLTARDVVYTYETLKALGKQSYYASCLDEIVSIEAADENTVSVLMKDPGLIALYSLNFPIIKEINENSPRFTGTGAYRVSAVNDDRITLSVNPSWWDRPPYISCVEFYARSSNDTALASYNAGQLDFVSTAFLAVGQYREAGVTVVKDIMTQSMETLLFNLNHSAARDADFRKAVAYALDRNPIITNVYMNRARKCDVPFPPDSWLYDGNSARYNYNLQLSEDMLSNLGYKLDAGGRLFRRGKRVSLKLLTSGTTENATREEAAKLISLQLEKLGIDVEIITAEHILGVGESEFMRLLKEGEWDIALVGFNLSVGSRLNKYLDTDGINNFGNYSDEKMKLLLENMNNAPDEESLRAAASALQQKFIDELPFIVLYFRLNSVVYNADIQGIEDMREPNIVRNIKKWYIKTAGTE